MFFGLMLLTGTRVFRTRRIINNQVTPIKEVNSHIQNNLHLIVIVFDEYTCVKTIRNMRKITDLIKKRNFPFIVVNAVEGLDPLTGFCPTCEFTSNYDIEITPSVLYLKKGKKIAVLEQGSDLLSIKELHIFLEEIKAGTEHNVS
ncbi:hypothetical protein ABET51_15815 [Metabacillus fastidiosus]|uniref:hypothetical protein n=1 Tax=Metabacillus fastidiosus TaxID=1458 RepID=UPI002E2251FC|nr:hypothetical protein [Metabacillus fastidiosus]